MPNELIPASISLGDLPALKQPLADGLFGGVHTMRDGRHVAVVYLNNARPPKRSGVDAMRKWAKDLGVQLITRAIGPLLVSTLGDLLPQEVVWTEDDWEPEPSASAWHCYLCYGFVSICCRGAQLGGVAVRLIPLTL
jgi:hypothetical protein